jgi:esterase/lipase
MYKGRLRIGTAFCILESIEYSNDNIDKITTPFYLLHGAQDKDCNPKGSSNLYEKAKIMDKTFILNDSN